MKYLIVNGYDNEWNERMSYAQVLDTVNEEDYDYVKLDSRSQDDIELCMDDYADHCMNESIFYHQEPIDSVTIFAYPLEDASPMYVKSYRMVKRIDEGPFVEVNR